MKATRTVESELIFTLLIWQVKLHSYLIPFGMNSLQSELSYPGCRDLLANKRTFLIEINIKT